MGKFTVGEVVLVSFPFSDLHGNKRRPSVVLAHAEFDDLILCQITSKPYTSKLPIQIGLKDFVTGGLPVISYARPDKLFTADASIIERSVGQLNKTAIKSILNAVRSLFTPIN